MTQQLVHAEDLMTQQFAIVSAIHGDNDFEVRFIPDKGYRNGKVFYVGRSCSFVRHGDSLYMNTISRSGIREMKKVGDYTPEDFDRILMDCFLTADQSTPCFSVNSPNFDEMDKCFTRKQHILQGGRINCQYVDIDVPKEIRKDKVAVKEHKRIIRRRIIGFKLSPSIIVESKYGYHCYWLLIDGQVESYTHIQMQLVQEFSGDENCIDLARVMRLPGFYHMKDSDEPFPVMIKVYNPELRYTQEDLKDALPELDHDIAKRVVKAHHKPKDDDSETPPLYDDERKQRIMNALINRFNIVSSTEDKLVMHCCLPEHEDHNPSAWFDTEYMWFHCKGCGHSYPVDLLAEELGWEDVLTEISKYDLDVKAEIERIKSLMVDVENITGVDLNQFDTQLVNDITDQVIARFQGNGQQITERHKLYIRNVAHVLWKSKTTDNTYLVPLDMGGGKSTIIQEFLEEVFNYFSEFGAIVAVERRDDAKALQTSLNEAVGEPVALAMLGFDKDECELNVRRKRDNEHCVELSNHRHEKCPYREMCPFYRQRNEKKNHPVLIITHKRLADNIQQLSKEFGSFKSQDGSKKHRELLIIDEKPFINRVHELDMKWFTTQSNRITKALGRTKNEIVLAEWKKAVAYVDTLMVAGESRERFEPVKRTFRFSIAFWTCFHRHFSYTDTIYSLPEIMECLLRNGGHRTTTKEGRVKLFTAQHTDYSKIKGFKTVIFDGTADIDIDYNHKDFNVLKFESLRTYEGLEFYQCDLFSGFKTGMSDADRIAALCEDVIALANENPTSKIFFPVFKDYENEFREHLAEYIEQGRVLVAHYGATRGSNKFRECDIVVLGGILHKGEDTYIEKARVIYENRGETLEDLSATRYGKVRRFISHEIELVKAMNMLVDYSQEIKRSSQRDNSRNIQGKVYIAHNDRIFLESIAHKFPGCQIRKWHPVNMIQQDVSKASNTRNMALTMDFISKRLADGATEITFQEIAKYLDRKPGAVSKVLKRQRLAQFIEGLNLIVDDCEDDKRKKKLVRK